MIFLFGIKKLWMKIETKKTILHEKKLKYDALTVVGCCPITLMDSVARLCSSSTWWTVEAPILESNQSEVLWNLLIISHSRLFFYCSDALKQPGHAIE